MALTAWEYPIDQKITGSTKISEADNKIQAGLDDLTKWLNGTDNYAGTGFLTEAQNQLTTQQNTFSTQLTTWQTQIDTALDEGSFYTKTQLDGGQLDNRYYTETESDARFLKQSDFNIVIGNSGGGQDTTSAIDDKVYYVTAGNADIGNSSNTSNTVCIEFFIEFLEPVFSTINIGLDTNFYDSVYYGKSLVHSGLTGSSSWVAFTVPESTLYNNGNSRRLLTLKSGDSSTDISNKSIRISSFKKTVFR